jgi:hypothetical protein
VTARAGRVGHGPRKLTPARRKLLLEAVEKGHSQTAAASVAGISKRTLQRELQRSTVLGRQIDAARDAAEAKLLDIVIEQAVKPGQWVPAAWLLERMHGYVRPTSLKAELTSPEHAAALAAAERIAGMTPEETEQALRANLRLLAAHDADSDDKAS